MGSLGRHTSRGLDGAWNLAEFPSHYPWCAKVEEGLGEAYFHEGLFLESRVAFETALALRKDRKDKILAFYVPRTQGFGFGWESPSLYRWLGHVCFELGDDHTARRYLEKSLALNTRTVSLMRFSRIGWHAPVIIRRHAIGLKRDFPPIPKTSFCCGLNMTRGCGV